MKKRAFDNFQREFQSIIGELVFASALGSSWLLLEIVTERFTNKQNHLILSCLVGRNCSFVSEFVWRRIIGCSLTDGFFSYIIRASCLAQVVTLILYVSRRRSASLLQDRGGYAEPPVFPKLAKGMVDD